MKIKVYEIELTRQDAEIIATALNPSNRECLSKDLILFCGKHGKAPFPYLDRAMTLAEEFSIDFLE